MNLKEFFEQLEEGWAGTRGVPDGSGPAPGMSGKGRRMGTCPKREEFDSDEAYEDAMKEWKKKNNIKEE
jgi:hypothetical protein